MNKVNSLAVLITNVVSFVATVFVVSRRGGHRSRFLQGSASCSCSCWALTETFDGDPLSPSQSLLPSNWDYVVTHRTHPKEHFTKVFDLYLADHTSDSCAGPNPNISPRPQHLVRTTQTSNGIQRDESFFICKNHMMSSMGDVEGYSVSAFWPKQEFNFADGGVLEFDVSLFGGHGDRSWWEVMLTPLEELKVGAAIDWLPISETYPKNRIVFSLNQFRRQIQVGTGALSPDGWTVDEVQWPDWPFMYPNDAALTDLRIRKRMQLRVSTNALTWGIETPDGNGFDEYTVDVPQGLPFSQGLVVFKTHGYTPKKDGNLDTYTFHWDNIRFNGPVVGQYTTHEADSVVYLQSNGDRPIGDSQTTSITLPQVESTSTYALFGQVHNPIKGQVLLSINGAENVAVEPYDYERNDCAAFGWKSFRMPLETDSIRSGSNTFEWTVGARPDNCLEEWEWNGFSIKFLQIQVDSN